MGLKSRWLSYMNKSLSHPWISQKESPVILSENRAERTEIPTRKDTDFGEMGIAVRRGFCTRVRLLDEVSGKFSFCHF